MTDTQTDNCNSVTISQQLQEWAFERHEEGNLKDIIQQVKELEDKQEKIINLLQLATTRLEIEEELEFRRRNKLEEFKKECITELMINGSELQKLLISADKYFGEK